MLTRYAERSGRPSTVVALWLGSLVRKSIVTTVVQQVSMVDECSYIEARLQATVLNPRHLALACSIKDHHLAYCNNGGETMMMTMMTKLSILACAEKPEA